MSFSVSPAAPVLPAAVPPPLSPVIDGPETRPVCFEVEALADPGLLPRTLMAFARRDLTPDGMRARRQGSRMFVSVSLSAMPRGMVHLVEGNLRQIVGVERVTVVLGACVRAAA